MTQLTDAEWVWVRTLAELRVAQQSTSLDGPNSVDNQLLLLCRAVLELLPK